jgi:hypothetical protein
MRSEGKKLLNFISNFMFSLEHVFAGLLDHSDGLCIGPVVLTQPLFLLYISLVVDATGFFSPELY